MLTAIDDHMIDDDLYGNGTDKCDNLTLLMINIRYER